MDIKYYCTNQNCSCPGMNRFEITFKSESIMDDKNIAVLFCSFCEKQMTTQSELNMTLDIYLGKVIRNSYQTIGE